ncbi:MAG: 2-dehydro-3-deoxygalactonokinase [Oscillospiraceae bacterium]
MFAIIDCGTTNTRVYILDGNNKIIAQGSRKVGVRNTSMTGSKDALRAGVCEAIVEAVENAKISLKDLEFAIASGMITSEIGLIEIPHLVAPVGLDELAKGIESVPGGKILPIDLPILFIRGIRNNYGDNATLRDIRNVDFMRGEETQVIGILEDLAITESVNIIVLSSHTKIIHADNNGKIVASLTTISGQLYEAILKETMIGKSLIENNVEQSGGYSFEEVVAIATEVVNEVGLDRCMMIPRFMQVLLNTDYNERNLFLNTGIAVDDMKIISEFERQGHTAKTFVLFGHESRCKLYSYLLKQKYGSEIKVISVSDKEKLSELTVHGAVSIVNRHRELQKNLH